VSGANDETLNPRIIGEVASVRTYLLSLPERLLRSAIGLGAGAMRELAELALPRSFRRSRLYQNIVDETLRYLIEEVGGVENLYAVGGLLRLRQAAAAPVRARRPSSVLADAVDAHRTADPETVSRRYTARR
jgi:hypothetical protein